MIRDDIDKDDIVSAVLSLLCKYSASYVLRQFFFLAVYGYFQGLSIGRDATLCTIFESMVGAAILNNNENTYYLFMTSSFHSGELITENGPYDLRVTLFAIFQGLGAEYWVHGFLFFAEAPCLALF